MVYSSQYREKEVREGKPVDSAPGHFDATTGTLFSLVVAAAASIPPKLPSISYLLLFDSFVLGVRGTFAREDMAAVVVRFESRSFRSSIFSTSSYAALLNRNDFVSYFFYI